MLTQADTDRALNVVCPLNFCLALVGEWCISRITGQPVAPHQHRLIKAGVIAPPAPAHPADDRLESA